MPKIHFAALFGVDLDYDIMPHWCEHYLSMGYDSYTVFLHSRDWKSERFAFTKSAFDAARFNVINAPDEPYTTAMRNSILDNFAKSLNPLDYLCVADSDEFHFPGPWAANFRDLILSCDVLYGTLVDRFGNYLNAALPDVPLKVQYPCSGDVFKIVYDRSDDLDRDRWRKPNPNKILAARAGLPVAHLGSHVMYTTPPDTRERRGCIVEHYKWRHNIVERLRTKWYYDKGYAQALENFFLYDTEKVTA